MNEKISFNRDAVLNSLIDALFSEIKRIRGELANPSPKEKARLRRELRGSSLALAELLQMLPDQSDVDQWLKIIQQKAPKKFMKRTEELLEMDHRSNFSSFKFASKARKDDGAEKIPKR